MFPRWISKENKAIAAELYNKAFIVLLAEADA